VTLLDLFDAALADRADAFAFNDTTYAQLNMGSLRVAARLANLGLCPGDRLALFVENRIGFVYTYLAALRLGAIAVPTNVLYRASDLQHVLEDSGASVVVASDQTRAHVLALERPRRPSQSRTSKRGPKTRRSIRRSRRARAPTTSRSSFTRAGRPDGRRARC
jgi:acyl-CoA synthetase (AMP-forming)/AMP-acid ligase II